MEKIIVPRLQEIRFACKLGIDRPATLCEVMKMRCSPDHMDITIKTVKEVITKILRHTVSEKVYPSADLTSLVKDLALTILPKDIKLCKPRPRVLNLFGKKCMRTVDTFDDELCNDLTRKLDSLNDIMKEHQKLNASLQKAQEKCWISGSKVSKYQLMLATANSSREHLSDRLPKTELRSRDRAILGLEKILKLRQTTADDDAIRYCNLLCREESCRTTMQKLSHEVTQDITFEIMDRLEGALITMKEVADTCLSTDCQKTFVGRLLEVDIRKMAESIIRHNSRVYCCPDPTEYTRIHGFQHKLPTSTFAPSV